jgi:LPS sulfotransferase NodH
MGIAANDWQTLLRENRFAVSPKQWGRAAAITVVSLSNSWNRRREMTRFGEDIAKARVEAPLFILGHWRTGTTLLHQLLALDERFAYPNLFQVSNPHTFLQLETAVAAQLEKMPPQKRPMDNMQVTAYTPGEDEFATAVMSLRSPLLGWAFPRREAHYDRYLTFQDVPEADVVRWRAALLWFLQKLTWRYQRPLLLKSPAHTGRIRLLLEMFPDARFVHIHRDPFTVFRSTQKLYQTAVPRSHLQRPDAEQITENILRRYITLYDAYFAARPLIPPGQFCEIAFEALEQDMTGQVRKLYEALNLGGFAAVEPRLNTYAQSLAGYKKNQHQPLATPLRHKVAQAWQRSFEEWHYAV